MDKIKKILEKNNITQVWLARELGVADAQLNRCLNGINLPNYRIVEKIYKILDLKLKNK